MVDCNFTVKIGIMQAGVQFDTHSLQCCFSMYCTRVKFTCYRHVMSVEV